MRFGIASATLVNCMLTCGYGVAGPTVEAEQIIDNPDASKTIVRPRVSTGGGYYRIRRGVPGSCRLFGMVGFLSDYVVRSSDAGESVEILQDGGMGKKMRGQYIEAMTCISAKPYFPKLAAESIDRHPDRSVTVRAPRIHTGPEKLPITSGHVGACRLLGYDATVEYSLQWSKRRAAGVSLALDGQIYSRADGTYVMAMGCRNARGR